MIKKITIILINAIFIAFISGLILPGIGQCQYFGKNKVQYTDFEWLYIQSEHFDVYYTQGGKNIAEFVIRVAEKSYQQLSMDLNYELQDRIKIIAYNSHNDFGQTNVDLNPPEESVGGFTEFFKNRVVIPYEGEWEKFRHVIHHELTHAVMLQQVYGAGAQSIITGLTQFQMPLWFIEGLAEWESRGWDIESDMFMRDATVSGYLPDIPQLSAFLAYKGGQSVLRYIADTYGQEKIGELVNKIKATKSSKRGFKQSIGIDVEELSKRWQLYLKRQYWPDIADRKEPEEFSQRITNHKEWRNFVNTSPVMSNRGDKIAFLSDKEDYFDIYIASAIDGAILKKVVRGQRAGDLEELHWLRGRGISWSPDDEKLVFSAKAGAEDQLHIVNVKKEKIEQSINVGLDGIYNSAWSPDGDEIAFMGLKDGQADLYIYNLKTKSLRKLTNDIFSNVEPSWSPDGKKLLFASDRGSYLDEYPDYLLPENLNMKNYDIYEINVDGSGIKRVVNTDYLERAPIYSPDQKYIAFTSDRSGVSNIYLKDVETGDEWPITNVLTGAYLPTWGGDANRLTFTSFYNAGYDVYMMKNPLKIKPGDITVQKTQFVKKLEKEEQMALQNEPEDGIPTDPYLHSEETQKYRHYVFDEDFANADIHFDNEEVFLDSTDYMSMTGGYKVHDYEVEFTTDLVYGNVGYDQFFGTQGYTNIMLSDVLGDHRLNLALNVYGDLKNADYAVQYYYLKNRLDIGGGIYHNAYFFYSYNTGWVRDRNYGLSLYMSNPFDRYTRISGGISLMGINRAYMDIPDEIVDELVKRGYLSPQDRYFWLNNLSYTKDTTVWGYTGPTNGTRWKAGITYSPYIADMGLDFTTVRLDWRRYMRIKNDYTFGLRLATGASFGKHAQKFFLGGTPNWINYRYSGGIRVSNIEEIYFSSFEMPLRGAYYYALEGTRFALTNLEFRFPFVRYLQAGFPLPILLRHIKGAAFMDMGLAWDEGDRPKLFQKAPNGLFKTDDLFASIGFGMRINLGMFLLRVDFAWPTNFYNTSDKVEVLWSLGADF